MAWEALRVDPLAATLGLVRFFGLDSGGFISLDGAFSLSEKLTSTLFGVLGVVQYE